jgi:ligand-binding sensor domain-containing protein
VPVDIGFPNAYFEDRAVTTILRDGSGTVWVGSFNGLYRSSPDGQQISDINQAVKP